MAMGFSAHARARSRRLAMQALYQWDLSGTDLAEIRRQFAEAEGFDRADRDYFVDLLKSVPARCDAIDRELAEYLYRPMGQVDPEYQLPVTRAPPVFDPPTAVLSGASWYAILPLNETPFPVFPQPAMLMQAERQRNTVLFCTARFSTWLLPLNDSSV